jgi:hypothetical protein
MNGILIVIIIYRVICASMVAYEARYYRIGPVGAFLLALLLTPVIALFATWFTPFKPYPRTCATCEQGTINEDFCPACKTDVFGREEEFYRTEEYADVLKMRTDMALKRNKWYFYLFLSLELVLVTALIWRITRIE